jgi:NET1-associated nuclear protein 1 (U3 small nucleolar RNA-associated protein 17)
VASARSISIWDIVGDFLMGVTSPGLHTTTSSNREYSTLFAANPQTQTIAVITKPALSNEKVMSGKQQKMCFNVEVYCLHSPIPLFRSSLENHPLALLSDPKTGDFLLVDAAANLQRVTCHNTNLGTVAPSDGLSIKSKSGLNDVFWDHSTQHLSPKSSAHVPAAAVDAEMPTLQSKRLAPIFDVSPSFSLPLVSVLFKNVVHSLTSDSKDS